MIAQLNTKLIKKLRDILHRLHHGEAIEKVQKDLEEDFQDVSNLDILCSIQELKSWDDGFTTADVKRLFQIYEQLHGHSLYDWQVPGSEQPGHPLQIIIEENQAFQSQLEKVTELLDSMGGSQHGIETLQAEMTKLGQFYRHYNRKEKLFFPIMERYGHYTICRMMWGEDDRIRNFYKGTKSMVEKLPELELHYVKKSYDLFANKFKDMIFEEEAFLLPIVAGIFQENDWLAIAEESPAFGYALIESEEEWMSQKVVDSPMSDSNEVKRKQEHLPIGGGFLTLQEANVILNNLPLEITFVDKHGTFKYFNERIEASEMMFIRTPTSIGRNVANCHPPSSLKKVMQLIRDLKTGKRTEENMWFKKKNQFIHITYKAVFDETGEYIGILEYVQDIQPFFDLPREVKRELRKLDEEN